MGEIRADGRVTLEQCRLAGDAPLKAMVPPISRAALPRAADGLMQFDGRNGYRGARRMRGRCLLTRVLPAPAKAMGENGGMTTMMKKATRIALARRRRCLAAWLLAAPLAAQGETPPLVVPWGANGAQPFGPEGQKNVHDLGWKGPSQCSISP